MRAPDRITADLRRLEREEENAAAAFAAFCDIVFQERFHEIMDDPDWVLEQVCEQIAGASAEARKELAESLSTDSANFGSVVSTLVKSSIESYIKDNSSEQDELQRRANIKWQEERGL